MFTRFLKWFCLVMLLVSFFKLTTVCASTHGIYVTWANATSAKKIEDFVKQSKEVGIDTFVIDVEVPNKRYAKNVAYVQQNGIQYVARVVIFPLGGGADQIKSRKYWEKRWKQMQYAISLGAKEIQIDYIRYKPSRPASPQNAKDIYEVIKYFRNNLKTHYPNVKLQMDMFGIATYKPSMHIGQDPAMFADSVDAICPMVYPSHFEPYLKHAVTPYETIAYSLKLLKQTLQNHPQVKIRPYIELFNYRYPLTHAQRIKYILAQMKAVHDADVDGWYEWSANNRYQILFDILRSKQASWVMGKTAEKQPEKKAAEKTTGITTEKAPDKSSNKAPDKTAEKAVENIKK